MESKNLQKIPFGLILKVTVAFALLYYLFSNEIINFEDLQALLSHPTTIGVVVLLYALNILIGTLRWKWLLSVMHMPLPFWQLFKINMISGFYSTFLPGSTGGDVMRGYYLAKTSSQGVTRALLSILADRLIGIFGLLILALSLMVYYYPRLHNNQEMQTMIEWIIGGIIFGGLIGLSTLMFAHKFDIRTKLKQLRKYTWIANILIHILEVLLIFRKRLDIVGICLGLSVIVQLLVALSIGAIGVALNLGPASMMDYIAAGNISMLANAVPLTPGGIGIGESAFNYFCNLLSGDNIARGYAAIFFAQRIIQMLCNLSGAWFFISYKHETKQSA
jgi:uncharacterized protein (TIRG00374 family)